MPFVFDASPLFSFSCSDPDDVAAVQLMQRAFDALGDAHGAGARWTGAVHDEVAHKVRTDDRFQGAAYIFNRWLPTPDSLTERIDHLEIQMLRDRLRGPGDSERKHLGEATSIVLTRRLPGYSLAMDDVDARAVARAEGLRSFDTLSFLTSLVETGRLSCDEAWDVYQIMAARSRMPTRTRSQRCPPSCGLHR